ncbi:unnamed protein product, partial [Pelagomonas calceolata]
MTTRRIADLAAATHVTVSARDENNGEEITIQLPIVRGSAGAPAVDISSLPAATGLYTLDPGFVATGSCRSAITFIDGPAGVLLHRGYGIDDLAARSSYLEVVYLLLNNRLPASQRRLDLFTEEVIRRMSVDRRLESFMSGFPDDAHPMAVMVGTVGALSAFYHDCRGVKAMNESERALAAVRVVAKLPTIAAMAYRHSVGLPYVAPRRGKSFAANLLNMCFASPLDGGEFVAPPAAFEKALDVFLLLHADHEQNASTATVRMAASSEANPFACVAAGIASLWGPMHGGANEACIRMLREIGSKERIPEFLARAKDKNDPFKLMGFGHRASVHAGVYRNIDPRAKEMKKLALDCIAEFERRNCQDRDAYVTASAPVTAMGANAAGSPKQLRELFHLAVELERAALADDYFVSRKLFPNVGRGANSKRLLDGVAGRDSTHAHAGRLLLGPRPDSHGHSAHAVHVPLRGRPVGGLGSAVARGLSRAEAPHLAAAPGLRGRDAAAVPRRPRARAQRPPEPQAELHGLDAGRAGLRLFLLASCLLYPSPISF